MQIAEQLDIDKLDCLLRAGDIYAALDITDHVLLQHHIIVGVSLAGTLLL